VNILLDTHVLIWSTGNPERLSEKVVNLLADTSNTLIFSLASIWEMQIKLQLGKLTLNLPLPELIIVNVKLTACNYYQLKLLTSML